MCNFLEYMNPPVCTWVAYLKPKRFDPLFRYWFSNLNVLIVCYYHVLLVLQSESALYSCLNAKEVLARNRLDIWSLSDSNSILTHNNLVHKWTLNTQVFVYELSACRLSPDAVMKTLISRWNITSNIFQNL